MKILQLITKRQYRGAEVFAANLSKELIALGHTIIFAGLYKNESNILEVEGAQNIDLSADKHGSFSLSLVRGLVNLIKQVDPDVIQCNGSDTLKYMIAASYMVKKKPVVYRNISTISEWLGSDIKLSVYKKIFSKVDHVSSVGSESIQDLIETLDYPENQTSVIRRGIPNKKIESLDNAVKLRNELGLAPDAKIVMHVGNFSPEKNHLFLLEIFEELQSTNPDIKLVCVGDGVTFENIQNKIKEKRLENSVFLLGFRKDIPELLSSADCIVLSSLVEGVPGVILEAAVQEKPAVASNVGGVKEVLLDGETGYIVDDFDKRIFTEKLVAICENDELRKRLGNNARNLVVEQFNPIKNARKFEKLYADLAGLKIHQDAKTQNLRILQIIQKKQYRGAEIFCCQLSNELEEKGNEVRVYSIYDGKANLPFKKPIESLERKQSFRYADFYGWKAIADIVKEFKPDIVQANASDTLKYAVFSKIIFKWKVPIIYRNASINSLYIKNKFSKLFNRFLFKNVEKIISVSKASKKDINQTFAFTKNKTIVIPIGVEFSISYGQNEIFSSKNVNLLHVGSFTREKNHLGLLSIFKHLVEHNKKMKLHLIGEGPLRQAVEKDVLKLGIKNKVIFYEAIKDPLPYIYAADVLLLPSIIEGLPGVILEAMFCKTPVVAYNVGGISEALNNFTGSLIENGDEAGFSEAVLRILENRDCTKVETAYKMVIKNYMNEEIAKKFVEVYRKVIV